MQKSRNLYLIYNVIYNTKQINDPFMSSEVQNILLFLNLYNVYLQPPNGLRSSQIDTSEREPPAGQSSNYNGHIVDCGEITKSILYIKRRSVHYIILLI